MRCKWGNGSKWEMVLGWAAHALLRSPRAAGRLEMGQQAKIAQKSPILQIGQRQAFSAFHHSSNSSLGAGRSRVSQIPGYHIRQFLSAKFRPRQVLQRNCSKASRWINHPEQGSRVHEHAWGCIPSRGILADMSDTAAPGYHGWFYNIISPWPRSKTVAKPL